MLLQEFEIFGRHNGRDGLGATAHQNPLTALDSVEHRAKIPAYVCNREFRSHEDISAMMILRHGREYLYLS